MTTQYAGIPVRPFRAPDVNAGTSATIDYSARNLDNELEAPSALRYRIDNLTDSVVIADWDDVDTPATEGSVTIAASLNAMSTQVRDRQLNQVTFEATFASGDKVVSMAYYQLCAVYQAQA